MSLRVLPQAGRSRSEPRRQLHVWLDYARLDPNGSWIGVKRTNAWHACAEFHVPPGRSTLRHSFRFDGSPLAVFTNSDIGATSWYWLRGEVGDGSW